jgi:hypothetical protein
MTSFAARAIGITGVFAVLAASACAKQDETAQPVTANGAQQPYGYAPNGQPPYGQQQAPYGQQTAPYGQQQAPYGQPTAYPTPAPTAPTAPTAPPQAAQLSTPGPFATPCQSDQLCGLAKCNVQAQKCVFPCKLPTDCATGASCNAATGFCLPGGS